MEAIALHADIDIAVYHRKRNTSRVSTVLPGALIIAVNHPAAFAEGRLISSSRPLFLSL